MLQSQFRNANIIVYASLCESFDYDLNNKTLDVIEALQGKVVNKQIIISYLKIFDERKGI